MTTQENVTPVLREGKQKAILIFNKVNGIFLNAINWHDPSTLGGGEHVVFVEVEDFDLQHETVKGVYPDYDIVDRRDQPQVVYEKRLDNMMAAKITSKYPVVQQVNVLGRAIGILAKKAGLTEDDLSELTEMLSYIELCKDVNKASKEFHRDSPDYIYISDATLAESENVKFEGGLHEFLGARQISGGSVF
jgi:hypothetical protein